MHAYSIAGKIGEWVQGVDQAGDPIIYSLAVTKSPFRTRTVVEQSDTLSVVIHSEKPLDHVKTRRAILAFADAHGFAQDCNYRVVIEGSPPRGKGLGSSSIDIASALLEIRKQRALNLSRTDLYKIMCKVERSDYLFEPQSIVAANPLDGSHSFVAHAPECSILAWDTEPLKFVETDALRHVDQRRRPFEREYRDIFAMIATGDTTLILQAVTKSAEINNRLLPKLGFETALNLVKKSRHIGLAAAHTGTWLGFVLARPIDDNARRLISEFFRGSLGRQPTLFQTGVPGGLP
jgi:L-threonine kinase